MRRSIDKVTRVNYNVFNRSRRASITFRRCMRNMAGRFFIGDGSMVDVKPFLCIEEQIQRLKDRGLIIYDEIAAASFLKCVNYYRFSGYTLSFRKNDVFEESTTFEHICQVYKLDSTLRGLLLYILDYVEVAFRTHIAYHHARKYGPLGYLDSSNFRDPVRHYEFMNKFVEDIDNGITLQEPFVRHHFDNYGGNFPIWVVVELISFGKLSKIYNNMLFAQRQEIAREYYGVHCDYIANWLHGLSIIRNICAHRGRLYNRNMTIKLKLPDQFWSLGVSNNKVFAYIYALKTLIIDSYLWNQFIVRLQDTLNEYDEVYIGDLGFPESWQEVLTRI